MCLSASLAIGAGAGCREFVEVAPHVHPAEGELHLATFGKLWVGIVAIDLQDALEAGEMAEQPLGFAVGCIDVGDAGRIEAAPGPVVGGISPELAGLGAPSTGIEHRHRRLVGEQLGSRAKHSEKALMQGAQMEGGMPNPVRQCRSIESDALAGIDLGLPVQRQVIGIFGHQNLGDGCLRRQAALDQPGRSLGLQDAIFAGSTGVFGTSGVGRTARAAALRARDCPSQIADCAPSEIALRNLVRDAEDRKSERA